MQALTEYTLPDPVFNFFALSQVADLATATTVNISFSFW
jgi:hypothetical protein